MNRRRWVIISLLFTASLINYLDRASLSLALPAISLELHLDPTTKGLLLSSFFWSYALVQIPVGLLVDRFPIRWFYASMFTVWSLACGLTGLATGLAILVFLRILLGIGESIYFPGGAKTVSLLFPPQERGLPSGLFNSGTRAGLVVGGLVLPRLIVWLGWRTAFMVLGVGSLLWLIPWLLTVPGSLRPADPAAARFHLPTFNRNLLGICLGFFSFDYFLYLLLTWLPDYLVQVRHLSLTQAGVFSAIPFVVFTAAEPLGGWIGDHIIARGGQETRARKTLVTVAFLLGLLLIPAVLATDVRVAIALIAGACGVGLSMGNLLAMVQNCAPPAEVAAWVGMQNFAGNCGGIVAPVITGVLISRTGSYTPGFTIAALVLVSGLVPYWIVVGDLKAPEHAGPATARAALLP